MVQGVRLQVSVRDDRRRSGVERSRPHKVVPGLDGLRGVAVLAVMAFHAGVSWARGGLLGVDVFFVLSGYLVTSLLLGEHARTATIRLRAFWARRARRLLPALLVLVAGVGLYARLADIGLSPGRLRGDSLATLFYVANWHFIVTGQDYFVRYGAPSPLLHTWSLAVEEQFYLVWPIVALVVLRRHGRRALGWVAAALAAASASLCALLYLNGALLDRLYYGTDTRLQAIMVGAVAAVLVALPDGSDPASGSAGGRRRPWIRFGSLAAAGLLAYCLHAVKGSGSFLYEGGFLVVAVTAAAVVVAVVREPRSVLSRALSWRPLRHTGRISYGLYLYHWPLFLYLTDARTGLSGTSLLAVRFAATFAVAQLSYKLVEQPVRYGRLGVRKARRHPGVTNPLRRVLVTGACCTAVGCVLAVSIAAPNEAGASLPQAASRAVYRNPSGATASNPERVLLIGDSIALTLGRGLDTGSLGWGVSVDNQGRVGCDLDPTTTVNVMGTVSLAAQGCPDWRRTWKAQVAKDNPDVVAVLLGRWECLDRIYGGRWTQIGAPAFDAHLTDELAQIIRIGSSHGAKVVFLTLPYIAQTTVQPDGAPWDMNLPARTDAYNADVRAAVARYPTRASVVDLNRMLDPAGHYVSYIDGVRVRSADDEHISVAGGEWLRPYLLPALATAGAARYEQRTQPSR